MVDAAWKPARRAGTVFGEAAELYRRLRPTYPLSSIERLIERAALQPGDPVLDVGCGTGQLSRALTDQGLAVTGVDPDQRMLDRAASELAEDRTCTLVCSRFEDFSGGPYRLLAAAQSWHWIEPTVGYRHGAELLSHGGYLALFWNRPIAADDELSERIGQAYRAYAPDLAPLHQPARRTVAVQKRIESIATSGYFDEPTLSIVEWDRTLSTGEYLDLLQTHSTHRLLAEETRAALLGGIGRELDRNGGRFVDRYACELYLAQVSD